MEALVLDGRLRDYVLLPILVVVFAQGVLRHALGVLMKDEGKRAEEEELRRAAVLQRSKLLRKNGHVLPPAAFERRRTWLLQEGLVLEEEEKSETPQLPMSRPEDMIPMMGAMRQSLASAVPNMVTMAWVSFFFSGFVLLRLPFPLTAAFKPMLQRGVHLSSLDASYVSALSWYFLSLFGLRGVFSLLLGGSSPANDMVMPAPTASQLPGDKNKKVKRERAELEMLVHAWSAPHKM